MDCHEPHPAPNEKTQPIQWTERPTGALVAVNSLWPDFDSFVHFFGPFELQRTAKKQIQPSQNHYIPIFTNLPQVGIWDN
jgi:hypothetical protein